jgi:hypothetical protein
MQENKFERTIQEKMAELRFAPSAPVWENVAEGIREKRKKRRALIWFFFGVLLLGGGAFLLLQNDRKESGMAQVAHVKPVLTTKENATGAAGTSKQTLSTAVNTQTSTEAAASLVKTANPGDNITSGNTGSKTISPFITAPDLGNKKHADSRISTDGSRALKQQSPTQRTVRNPALRNNLKPASSNIETVANTIAPAEKAIALSAPGLLQHNENETAQLPAAGTLADSAVKTTLPLLTDSMTSVPAVTKPAPGHRRRQIEWSVAANAGFSNIRTANSGTSADMLSSITATRGSVNGTPDFHGGLSAGVEVTAQLPISKKLSLTAGLGFAHYSATATVQDAMSTNSTGIGAFSPSSVTVAQKSTARYDWQYMILSAGIRWKMLRLPLNFSAALSAGQQIGGHSWSYPAGSGTFNPAENAKRFQLFGQLGAEYRIWHKGAHSLQAGPLLQTGFTRSGPDNNLRLSAAALKLRFQF